MIITAELFAARRLGICEDATWEEIDEINRVKEAKRLKISEESPRHVIYQEELRILAKSLGLPENSSLSKIHKEQIKRNLTRN